MRIQIYALTGLCHEDIVVLGQFCAEVNTQWLFRSTKCSVRDMKKISTNFGQGSLIIIIFFWRYVYRMKT